MNIDKLPSSQPAGPPHPDNGSDYLSDLLNTLENGDVDELEKNKPTWLAVIEGLSDHFLAETPIYGSIQWTEVVARYELIGQTFAIIRLVSTRIPGIFFGKHETAKKLLCRLFDISCQLNAWSNYRQSSTAASTTPESCFRSSFETTVSVIQNLATKSPIGNNAPSPNWMLLRDMLEESAQVLRGALVTICFSLSV